MRVPNPPQGLRFFTARLSDVCEMIEPWDRPNTRVVVGYAYLFELETIRRESAAAMLHLDAWFIRHVAVGFYDQRPQDPCVLFLSNGTDGDREFFQLTVSERTGCPQTPWLERIPGLFELGKDALPSNACLWASWDGETLSRVHDFLDDDPSGLMIADIGGRQGISIYTDQSEDNYIAIQSDPVGRWDYSPIPRDGVEQIDIGAGRVVALEHLAFQSIPPESLHDDEDAEVELAAETLTTSAFAGPGDAQEKPSHDPAELIGRIAHRATRQDAIIEACSQRATTCIPAIICAMDQLTWAEVDPVRNALLGLAPEIVDPLIGLLSSKRKQTAEVVTWVLGRLAPERACFPLLEMMEAQAGTANAIRARDALIEMDEVASFALTHALDFDGWETRTYAAKALGAIGATAAVGRLREVAEADRSAKVRDAAREAIAAIEGADE